MTDHMEIQEPWNKDQLAANAGVIFGVQFVATVSIKNIELQNKSEKIGQRKTLDECINFACEQCHLKQNVKMGSVKKKKEKIQNLTVETKGLLIDAKLKITDESLTIFEFATNKTIAESDICKIKYVSIGDSITLDFIGYVVSNTPQQDVCHVIQCLGGTAFEVLSTITQGMYSCCLTKMREKAVPEPLRGATSLTSCRSGCSCCDSVNRSSYWSFLPESLPGEGNEDNEERSNINKDPNEEDNGNYYVIIEEKTQPNPLPYSKSTAKVVDSAVTSTIHRELPPVPNSPDQTDEKVATSPSPQEHPHVPHSPSKVQTDEKVATSPSPQEQPHVPHSPSTVQTDEKVAIPSSPQEQPHVPHSPSKVQTDEKVAIPSSHQEQPHVPHSPSKELTNEEVSTFPSHREVPGILVAHPITPPPVVAKPPTTSVDLESKHSESVEGDPSGEQWYVGEMTRKDADALLRCEGEFLVRISKRKYVLSVRCDTIGIHSQLAEIDQQKFTYHKYEFTSVTECINFLYNQKVPLKFDQQTVILLSPYKKPAE